MKKVNLHLGTLIIITLLIQCLYSTAQVPQKISYQSVIRNSSGELVKSATVGIRISILQGSVSGTVTYLETHSVITNVNGLATLAVGTGTPVTGTFAGIDWSNGPYFLKVETDPNGGSSYLVLGTSEILSVPYAIHAKTADGFTNPQWITNGSNLYYNNGNVGIGISNPTSKLEVAGIIASSNGSNTSYVQSFGYGNNWDYSGFLVGDFTTGKHWGIKYRERSAEQNNLAIDYFNGATFNTMFSIKTNGNIGIGLTNPTNKLEVAGNILASDSVGSSYLSSFGIGDTHNFSHVQLGDKTTNKYWQFVHKQEAGELNNLDLDWYDGSTWHPFIGIKTNGNVGIGTLNPTNKLDVVGEIGAENIWINNSSGPSFMTCSGVGDDWIFSSLILGDKSTTKNWSLQHRKISSELNNFSIEYFNGSTNTPVFSIKPNGNVGVGTVFPLNKLDVIGSIASSDTVGSSYISSFGHGDTHNFSHLQLGDKTTGKYWQFVHKQEAGELNNLDLDWFDGSTWHPYIGIKTNGNVGIGTTNPSRTLEVKGGALVSNDGYSWLECAGGGDEYNYSGLVLSKPGVSSWSIRHKKYSTQLNFLAFEYESSGGWHQMLAIDTNGNVGIGTSDGTNQPKAKLQVTGGDVYIENIGSGIIMKSPNGNCWRITIDDSGNLIRTAITCP